MKSRIPVPSPVHQPRAAKEAPGASPTNSEILARLPEPGPERAVGLPPTLAAAAASSWGADVGGIEVRKGGDRARSMGAAAIAQGGTIFLDDTLDGAESGLQEHVLAHELAHIVQQDTSQPPPDDAKGGAADLEGEADAAAEALRSGRRFDIAGKAAPGRAQPFGFDWSLLEREIAHFDQERRTVAEEEVPVVGTDATAQTEDEEPKRRVVSGTEQTITRGNPNGVYLETDTRTRTRQLEDGNTGRTTTSRTRSDDLSEGKRGHSTTRTEEVLAADPAGTVRAARGRLDEIATNQDARAHLAEAEADDAERRMKEAARRRQELEAAGAHAEDIEALEQESEREEARMRDARKRAEQSLGNAKRLREARDGLDPEAPDAAIAAIGKLDVKLDGDDPVNAAVLGVEPAVKTLSKRTTTESSEIDVDLLQAPGAARTKKKSVETVAEDGSSHTESSSRTRSLKAKDGQVTAGGTNERTVTDKKADGSSNSTTTGTRASVGVDANTGDVTLAGGGDLKNEKTTGTGLEQVTSTRDASADVTLKKNEAALKTQAGAAREDDNTKVATKVSGDGSVKADVTYDKKLDCFLVTLTVSVSGSLGGSADASTSKDAEKKAKAGNQAHAKGNFGIGASAGAGATLTVVKRLDRGEMGQYLADASKAMDGKPVSDKDLGAIAKNFMAMNNVDDLLADDIHSGEIGRSLAAGEERSVETFTDINGNIGLGAGGSLAGDTGAGMAGPGIGVDASASAGKKYVKKLSVKRLRKETEGPNGRKVVTEPVQISIAFTEIDTSKLGAGMSYGAASGSIEHAETHSTGLSAKFEFDPHGDGYDDAHAELMECGSPEELKDLLELYEDYRSEYRKSRKDTEKDSHQVGAGGITASGYVESETGEDVVFGEDGLAGSTATGRRKEGVGAAAGDLVSLGQSQENSFEGSVTKDGMTGSLTMTDDSSTSLVGGLWKETEQTLSKINLSEDDMRMLVSRAREKDKWTSCVHDHRLLDGWETLRRRLRDPSSLMEDEEKKHDPDGARWLGRARALAAFTAAAAVSDGRIVFQRVFDEWGIGGVLGTREEWPMALSLHKKTYAVLKEEAPAFVKKLRSAAAAGPEQRDAVLRDEAPRKEKYVRSLTDLRDTILGHPFFDDLRAQADMGAEMAGLLEDVQEAWLELQGVADGRMGEESFEKELIWAQIDARSATCKQMIEQIAPVCRRAVREAGVGTWSEDPADGWEVLEEVAPALKRIEVEWKRCAMLFAQLGRTQQTIDEIDALWGYRAAKGHYDRAMDQINHS